MTKNRVFSQKIAVFEYEKYDRSIIRRTKTVLVEKDRKNPDFSDFLRENQFFGKNGNFWIFHRNFTENFTHV